MEIELKNQPLDLIFRNTFVIRNSDLKLLEEKGYFSTISNIVMGWDYEDLKKVRAKARVKGRLTEQSTSERAVLTNKGSIKVKNLRKSANEVSKEIINYLKESKEKEYGKYEIKILNAKKLNIDYKKRLKYLENIIGKTKYKKSKNFLEKYINVSKELETVEEFNNDSSERLKAINKNIDEFKNRISELEKKNSNESNELNQTKQKKEKINVEFDNLERKKTNIEIMSKNLKDWKNSNEEIKNIQNIDQYLKFSYIFIILSLVTLPGSIISILLNFNILGFLIMIFGIIFGFMIGYDLKKYFKYLKLQKRLITILEHSNNLDVKFFENKEINNKWTDLVDSTSDSTINYWLEIIEKKLEHFFINFHEINDSIRECESRIKIFQEQLEVSNKQIIEYKKNLSSFKEEKRILFNYLKIENDEEFKRKFESRLNFKSDLDKYESHLKEFFGLDTEKLEEWQDGLKNKYEEFKDVDVKIVDNLTEINKELDNLHKEIEEELPKQIERWNKKLTSNKNILQSFANKQIELKLKEFEIIEDYFDINSTDQLEVLLQKINEFKTLIDNDKELTQLALEIFEQIEKEEIERIIELFKSGDIPKLFNRITAGKYTDVQFNYDYDKNKEDYFIVKKSNGTHLTSNLLSLGTNDQLYYSIRFALANKLLKGNTGFFLIDDAFITSDSNRLKSQFEILKDFAQIGWQILYFSNKEEIIDLFKENKIEPIFKLPLLD